LPANIEIIFEQGIGPAYFFVLPVFSAVGGLVMPAR
jgi:hypothetical protein